MSKKARKRVRQIPTKCNRMPQINTKNTAKYSRFLYYFATVVYLTEYEQALTIEGYSVSDGSN